MMSRLNFRRAPSWRAFDRAIVRARRPLPAICTLASRASAPCRSTIAPSSSTFASVFTRFSAFGALVSSEDALAALMAQTRIFVGERRLRPVAFEPAASLSAFQCLAASSIRTPAGRCLSPTRSRRVGPISFMPCLAASRALSARIESGPVIRLASAAGRSTSATSLAAAPAAATARPPSRVPTAFPRLAASSAPARASASAHRAASPTLTSASCVLLAAEPIVRRQHAQRSRHSGSP